MVMRYNTLMHIHRSRSGFTILEQLVAATVLLIIFVAVSQAFVAIGIINNRASAQTQAIELMQEKLELARNTPYANLAIGTKSFEADMAAFPALKTPRSATVAISEVSPGTLKRIDISITYTQSGTSRTVSTATLIGIRGLNR